MSIINGVDFSNTGLITRSNSFNSSININDNKYDSWIEREKNLVKPQFEETYENDLYKWKPNHLLMSNFYTYVINNESVYDTTYNNMVNLYNSIIEKHFNTLKLLESFDETFSDIQLLSIIYNNVTTSSSSYTINLFNDNIKDNTFKIDTQISSNKIVNNNYYHDVFTSKPCIGHMDYDGTFYLNSMNSINGIILTTYNYEIPSITRKLTINCQTNNSTQKIEFDDFYNNLESVQENFYNNLESVQENSILNTIILKQRIIAYRLIGDNPRLMRGLNHIFNIDNKNSGQFTIESININIIKNYKINKITGSSILNYVELDNKSSRPIYWFLNESYFINKQIIFAVKKHYQSDNPHVMFGKDFYYLEEINKISVGSRTYSSYFTINILDNSILYFDNEYYMIIISDNRSYLYKLNFIHEDYYEIGLCFSPKIICNSYNSENKIDNKHVLDNETKIYNLKENTKYIIDINNDIDIKDENFNILSISVKHINDNSFNDLPCIKKKKYEKDENEKDENDKYYYELYTSGKGNYKLIIAFSHITGISNIKTFNILVGENANYLIHDNLYGTATIDIDFSDKNLINNSEDNTLFINYEHNYTLNEICYLFTNNIVNDISIIPSSLQIEYNLSKYDSSNKNHISKDVVTKLYFERNFSTDTNNNVISNKLHLTCNILKKYNENNSNFITNYIIPVKIYYFNGISNNDTSENYIEKETFININLSNYFEEPTENPILPSTEEIDDSSLDTINI